MMDLGPNGEKLKKKTKIIQSGLEPDKINGSLTTPIYHNSTIAFKNYKNFINAKKDRFSKPYYGRFGTYTTKTLEKIVCDLYSSDKAIITSSGLSAIIISISSLLKKNDNILVVENCYEPVSNFLKYELRKFGINSTFYNSDYNEGFKELINNQTRIIYLESPGSLNFEVQDIEKFVKIAKKNNIITIMDNTWSTWLNCNPIKFGVDIVIESGTKYFSGHSDCFCGLIACSKNMYKKINSTKIRHGDFVSSESCFLAIRGLKTLSVRLQRHYENTKKVISFLEKKKIILDIIYPPSSKFKNHQIWKKYHSSGNGLITIKIKFIKKKRIEDFIDNLKVFKIGFSWGGFESLILPIDKMNPNNTNNDENIDFYFRLHIGLEDSQDIIEDLNFSLDKYSN